MSPVPWHIMDPQWWRSGVRRLWDTVAGRPIKIIVMTVRRRAVVRHERVCAENLHGWCRCFCKKPRSFRQVLMTSDIDAGQLEDHKGLLQRLHQTRPRQIPRPSMQSFWCTARPCSMLCR